MRSDLVDLTAILVTTTARARLYEFENGRAWLPISQHEWDEATKTVTLPQTLAEEKGLV
jgi:hypothetical protein